MEDSTCLPFIDLQVDVKPFLLLQPFPNRLPFFWVTLFFRLFC